MTAVLVLTVGFLLMLCATLTVLLIGRDRAATKRENMLTALADELAKKLAAEMTKARHLQERVTEYRGEVARLSADNGDLRERNSDLRDQLHAQAAGEPSLTESFTAWLGTLPTTDNGENPR